MVDDTELATDANRGSREPVCSVDDWALSGTLRGLGHSDGWLSPANQLAYLRRHKADLKANLRGKNKDDIASLMQVIDAIIETVTVSKKPNGETSDRAQSDN